jgi:sigma-E factor negative regulatory protein RseB
MDSAAGRLTIVDRDAPALRPASRAASPQAVDRRTVWLGLGTVLAVAAWPVRATTPDAGSVDAWIARIKAAGLASNFAGTFVVTTEGTASSSRIVHFGQGKDRFERVETLDGPPRLVLRHNDALHTVWPQSRLVVVEQRAVSAGFPSFGETSGVRLDKLYTLEVGSEGRIAGRAALVLTFQPRDQHRFAHRLWVDRKTDLLLRADVLGLQQQVLESSAFTDLTLGVRQQAATILDAMAPRGPGWRVVRAALQTSSLDKEGWAWKGDPMPGFYLVSCVRRPMAPEGDDPRATLASALQAVFSDGLASVSVFVEDLQPARHQKPGAQRTGATQTVTRRIEPSFWITVVGDVPERTAHRFAESLIRK